VLSNKEQDSEKDLILIVKMVLEVLANATRHEKEIKGTENTKEKIQLWLFTNNMVLWFEYEMSLTD
jgi:hypothetical protein